MDKKVMRCNEAMEYFGMSRTTLMGLAHAAGAAKKADPNKKHSLVMIDVHRLETYILKFESCDEEKEDEEFAEFWAEFKKLND